MPDKRICLYDSSNSPLQVAGIRVELHNASTKAYIDGDASDDLNKAAHSSNTWGVVLNFPSGPTPVDIYISDPTYKYPGNTMVGRLKSWYPSSLVSGISNLTMV